MKENIISHDYKISRIERMQQQNHKSLLVWFTGLSGSGKSTIANLVESGLFNEKIKTYTLDGDNIRKGINKNLTFSPEDRKENVRRIAEIANLMIDSGVVVLGAFVSPYEEDRQNVKRVVGEDNFIEVYVNTSVEECEKRDIKGLYKKAREGKIKNMTGISAPYEEPKSPCIEIKTEEESIPDAVQRVIEYIKPKLKLNN